MNIDNKLTILKNINHFNFDGPYCEKTAYNSNNAVTKIITSFIRKYYDEIKQHYTFVVKYDNDIYSYLAFRLVRAASVAIQTEIDIRIMGEIKSPEEKNFFKGLKTIGYKKAKKLKKAVLIVSNHPICKVEKLDLLSKDFIEIYSPIKTLTPENLNLIQEFYINENSTLYRADLGKHTMREMYWYEFFQYPIGTKDLLFTATNKQDCVFCPIELNGTEDDFRLYDELRKLDIDESFIFIYNISFLNEEQIKFIKCNLNPYLSFKNQLNDFNSFTDMEIKLLAITRENVNFLVEQ